MHEDTNAVKLSVRFFVYTVLLFGVLLGLTHFISPRDIIRLKENGLIEWEEFFFLISTAAVFAVGSRTDRTMRELNLLLCLTAVLAGIRELDGFFDTLPTIRWWMPAIIVFAAGVTLAIHRRHILSQQIKCFIGQVPFGMLWAGVVIAAIIAQLVGNGQFLKSSLGEDYQRPYKLFIEEIVEWCGYYILLLGALEAVVFKEKPRQNFEPDYKKSMLF